MTTATLKNKKAAGACNTYGNQKENVHPYSNTGIGGGNPSGLRAKLFDQVFSPLWARLPQAKGRLFFKRLAIPLGNTRLLTEVCASYIRFLNGKGAA